MVGSERKTTARHEFPHTPKTHFETRAVAAMEKHLPKPEWLIRQKSALTARMLAATEHASGLARQITTRSEAPGTMRTADFGLGFGEVRVRAFLSVEEELKVVRGDSMANPHLRAYRAPPDVHCIAPTHPPHSWRIQFDAKCDIH